MGVTSPRADTGDVTDGRHGTTCLVVFFVLPLAPASRFYKPQAIMDYPVGGVYGPEEGAGRRWWVGAFEFLNLEKVTQSRKQTCLSKRRTCWGAPWASHVCPRTTQLKSLQPSFCSVIWFNKRVPLVFLGSLRVRRLQVLTRHCFVYCCT